MKAWILTEQSRIEDQPLKLVNLSKPDLKKEEIRVEILNCGICRTDLHIAE